MIATLPAFAGPACPRRGWSTSPVDEILARIPTQQLAGRLGVDERTAEQATRHALPALLGGIQANTDDPGGASSFANAVQQHDSGLVAGGVDLDRVDTGDGEKIVGHVFGAQRGPVVQQLGGLTGQDGKDLMAKLLPILAPIVMSWLAGKLAGGPAAAPTPQAPAPSTGGGGLGDLLGPILGNVLGGGSGSAAPNLGELLGGLLGGGRR